MAHRTTLGNRGFVHLVVLQLWQILHVCESFSRCFLLKMIRQIHRLPILPEPNLSERFSILTLLNKGYSTQVFSSNRDFPKRFMGRMHVVLRGPSMTELDLIIKNGKVVTASDTYIADVGVRAGKIDSIAANLSPGADTTVIDAKGKYIFPGGIDVHVHLQLPFSGTISADDFENGTKAAACGGVTTLVDFAIQTKGHSISYHISGFCNPDKRSLNYGSS